MILKIVPPAGTPEAEAARRAAEAWVWAANARALIEAGVPVGGNALHSPATATTQRMREGRREIRDGPYAATKEHFGGYYVIEAPDLDAALDRAARSQSAARGTVELRPIATP